MRGVHAELATMIIARDVAAGFELAKSLGYKVPKSYDVGVSVIRRIPRPKSEACTIRIRVEDVFLDTTIIWPHLDGRCSMRECSEMSNIALERLRADAMTVPHVWIARHGGLTKEQAADALVKLSKYATTDEQGEAWFREARDRANRQTFTKRGSWTCQSPTTYKR